MQLRLLFWILMLFWLLVGLWGFWPGAGVVAYGAMGWGLVLFLLVCMLGWRVFGPPVQG